MYKEIAKQGEGEKSVVAVACAEDVHVLEAVSDAREMANFVLIGDEAGIRKAAQEAGANISGMEIVHEPEPTLACAHAVSLVSQGKAEALMKGLVDTSIIMKAVLSKEAGMRTDRKLSHLAVFELPTYHKLLFVTDAAINIAPDLAEKKEIVQNAVEAVNNLGITSPKVAILAAKEKADPKMPVTMDAAELATMHANGGISGCILDGPLALDNAVSRESAEIKGIKSPVAGDADILMCPNIESGNILYKSLAFLAGGKNGGVVLGAKKPVILTSRADSAESKLISIILGILAGRSIA
ncbi:MAG: bifunctional enoyl-CoA hydratase/phosphate acetyltransferase [Defluviitaleaceae bacterium]|nr:bifunctional enoyl-CoA hydratase/phosphate acetyltransferase [Defluviitaleaceae bacterium]